MALANRIKSSPANWSALQPYLGMLMDDLIQVSSACPGHCWQVLGGVHMRCWWPVSMMRVLFM